MFLWNYVSFFMIVMSSSKQTRGIACTRRRPENSDTLQFVTCWHLRATGELKTWETNCFRERNKPLKLQKIQHKLVTCARNSKHPVVAIGCFDSSPSTVAAERETSLSDQAFTLFIGSASFITQLSNTRKAETIDMLCMEASVLRSRCRPD